MLKKEKEHKTGNLVPIKKRGEDQKPLSAKELKAKKLELFGYVSDSEEEKKQKIQDKKKVAILFAMSDDVDDEDGGMDGLEHESESEDEEEEEIYAPKE